MTSVANPLPCTQGSKGAAWAAPFVCVLLTFAACTPTPHSGDPDRQLYTFSGATMGTYYTLKVVGSDLDAAEQRLLHDAVDARLQDVNALMSTYDPNSELSRFNQWSSQEPFSVSAPLMDVFTRAQRISAESDGAFDVTVGRLVDLWGFGPIDRDPEHPPSDIAVAKALRQSGYQHVHLDPDALTVAKDYPMMYVDLSAIAKGYGVDYAAQALEELGYSEYMIEVGGEVRTRGRNAQGAWWRIAVEEPVSSQREVRKIVPMADMAMATSGDYRNFVETNGVRLSHTIDPKTGRPIHHRLASATVLHEECAMADGYATAIMALGPQKGMALAERLGLAVFLVLHEEGNRFSDQQSAAFERYIATHAME